MAWEKVVSKGCNPGMLTVAHETVVQSCQENESWVFSPHTHAYTHTHNGTLCEVMDVVASL